MFAVGEWLTSPRQPFVAALGPDGETRRIAVLCGMVDGFTPRGVAVDAAARAVVLTGETSRRRQSTDRLRTTQDNQLVQHAGYAQLGL